MLRFNQSKSVLRIVEKLVLKMLSIKVILLLGLALAVASAQVNKDIINS